MPKIALRCPHCHESYAAELVLPKGESPGGERAKNGQITPLTAQALQDVLETIQRVGPGVRASTASLLNTYQQVAGDHLRKRTLTRYALVMGLRRYGCEAYRTRYERGYVTPDTIPTEPLPVDAKAAARRDAELQRQAIQDHRGAPKPVAAAFDPLSLIEMPDELPL